MIEQMAPWFGDEEKLAVLEYMDSGGWLTEFDKTRELEAMIADYVGAEYCVMMPNATLALYAMLKCSGIGPGDRVIVPAFTMVATANAVAMTGAQVRFMDIELETLCMDLYLLSQVVEDGVAAVLLVSLNGRSLDMAAVLAICQERRILLFEDAAQALGSAWNSQHLGTFGKAGVFSFSVPKVITMGQGGCVVTNSETLTHRLRRFKDFGRDRAGANDDYLEFGINLKFTDLQAVIGIEQMKKLPYRVERKVDIYALYMELLKDVPQVELIPTNLDDTSPWFVDILCQDREGLQGFLLEAGITTRPFYPALPDSPAWRFHKNVHCPVARDVAARGLWLPSSSFLTDTEITFVCEQVRAFYGT